MVHGSPRPVANQSMFEVVEEVKARGVFDQVEVGFMECNAPTIDEAADTCAAAGADKVIAVPYFLHTGTHVADDLPTLLDEAAAASPARPVPNGPLHRHVPEADRGFRAPGAGREILTDVTPLRHAMNCMAEASHCDTACVTISPGRAARDQCRKGPAGCWTK